MEESKPAGEEGGESQEEEQGGDQNGDADMENDDEAVDAAGDNEDAENGDSLDKDSETVADDEEEEGEERSADLLSKDQSEKLAEALGGEWQKLATELNFPEDDISFIAGETEDVQQQALKMITLWKVRNDGGGSLNTEYSIIIRDHKRQVDFDIDRQKYNSDVDAWRIVPLENWSFFPLPCTIIPILQ